MKIALTLCLAFSAPCVAQFQNTDDLTTVETTLTEVRNTPDAFKGVKLTFPIQFAWVGKISNPFFTRFVPSDFANFQGWATEQPIWRKEAYDDVFGLLFVAKTNPLLSEVFRIGRYERLLVTAVVRDTFQGQPWMEVLTFSREGTGVDTATLAHMFRGEQHMADRNWNRAISELSLSLRGDAPIEVQGQAHKNLGVCYLRMGEPKSAINHLGMALEMIPGSDVETQRLAEIARSHPTLELDRQVQGGVVGDNQRPLWEAFDNSAKPTPGQ